MPALSLGSVLVAVLGGALLFALYGFVLRGGRRGEGCSSCTTECPAKEVRHGPR